MKKPPFIFPISYLFTTYLAISVNITSLCVCDARLLNPTCIYERVIGFRLIAADIMIISNDNGSLRRGTPRYVDLASREHIVQTIFTNKEF